MRLISLVFVLWRPLRLKNVYATQDIVSFIICERHTITNIVAVVRQLYLVGVICTWLSFFHFTGAPTSSWNHSRLTKALFHRAEAALLLYNTDTQTIMKYTQMNNLRWQQLGWFVFSINRDLHVFYGNFYAKTEIHKESNMPHIEFNLTTWMFIN